MYQKHTGIILKKHPFGEADELLTIYTRASGKIRVKAAASRKPLSKLAGHLHSLNEIEFESAQTARRGGVSLPILISVRALSINSYLRQNLRKFGYALVGIETLYRLTGDGQENGEAYDALRSFLRQLGETAEEKLALRKFQLNLLAVSGYAHPDALNPIDLKLNRETEAQIDRHLSDVLEREIKSMKVLDSLI